MDLNNKKTIAILAGVIVLAAVVVLLVYSSEHAGRSVSDRANPASGAASPTDERAAVERGPGAPDRGDAASGRLLAGTESREEASDEVASDVAQKKRGKKKRRQRRGQDTESPDDGANGAQNKAELPPPSIMEGDH